MFDMLHTSVLCQGRARGGGGVLARALCDIGVPADGLVSRKRPGTAPLHVAAAAGNLEVVRALLSAGRHQVEVDKWTLVYPRDGTFRTPYFNLTLQALKA
jgi:hypothetical protein